MAEVVASVFADSPEQTLRDAERAAMGGADVVELRLDRWRDDQPLGPVVGAIGLPVIATCRSPRDGGHYEGSSAQRIARLEAALDAGAHGVDVEEWESWRPAGAELVIGSYHDFTRVPSECREIRDRLLASGAHVAKVVGMAHDLADAAPLLDLMASSDPDLEPTVAFAMGGAAAPTRVLACALGARFVYAALDPDSATAPGQLPLRAVTGNYGCGELGLQTSIFGLLGNPAAHSLGPWLHNRALRHAGVDGVYLPFETARPREVLAMLPRRRLLGVSVTAPHKGVAAQMCHRLTPEASEAGAVNTLLFEAHGAIVGHNTDVAGVIGALRRAGCRDGDGRGVVLGGGGAARAAVLALQRLGLAVTLMVRSLDPVRGFAKERGVELASLQAELLAERAPRVVVHATPVGGAAHGSADTRLVADWMPRPGTFVLDMVYTPEETRLLRDVAAVGGIPVSGVEMFLTQAAEQLRAFTGNRPEEPELRRYLAGALDG